VGVGLDLSLALEVGVANPRDEKIGISFNDLMGDGGEIGFSVYPGTIGYIYGTDAKNGWASTESNLFSEHSISINTSLKKSITKYSIGSMIDAKTNVTPIFGPIKIAPWTFSKKDNSNE
jgi:hypothetical protein